jgi:flagellar hook-associated protein 3 FlgL
MSINRVSSLQFSVSQMLAMQLQQRSLYHTMGQISSGKKYSTPADDPDDANRLFRLQQQQSFIHTYKKSASVARSQLEQEDSELSAVAETLNSARETIIALNSAILSPADAGTLAYKLQSLLDQLTDQANTKINGRYLFSGSQDVMPIAQDVNGNYFYQGDQEYQDATISGNITVQMNDTAQDIFYQLPTSNTLLTGYSGESSVTAANPGLVAPGQLTALHSLTLNELNINGIDIGAAIASSDTLSTSDNIASALAITAAINQSSNLTDTTAYYANNVLTFSGGAGYVDHTFVAGELTINGVQILGNTTPLQGATVVDRLASLINSQFTDQSVVASNSAGQLCLTSTNGSNLQIASTGGSPAGLALAGFNFVAGDNKVQRADITLKSEQPMIIDTNTFVGTANAIGFSPDTYDVINNSGNAVMSAPIMRDTVTTANAQDRYLISFTSPTTYNVYRQSDPFTPVSSFKVYHAGQIYEQNAVVISEQPATYTTGDNIVIDGIEVSISGVPATGDVFMIDKNPQPINDIFTALNDAIYAATNYKGQNTRYNYNMNIALENIVQAQTRLTDIQGMVGTRLQSLDIAAESNAVIYDLTAKDMSNIEDVDLAEASSKFMQMLNSLQATQRTTALAGELSLFNFLKL